MSDEEQDKQPISTIQVEFLRLGDRHNHLLNPDTQYLVLCGQKTSAVRAPWSHAQLVRHLDRLCYKDRQFREKRANVEREVALRELSAGVSEVLNDVSGLAPLHASATQRNGIAHIELFLEPAEVAMIPFEATRTPKNCKGGGSWFSVQTTAPVCITRTIRSFHGREISWPTRPRILFAWATHTTRDKNARNDTVPHARHEAALRNAVADWVRPDRMNDPNEVEGILKVLPEASIADIARECKTGSYTHIHILAHGVRNPAAEGEAYGLALRRQKSTAEDRAEGDREEAEVVSGERLATAVLPLQRRHGVRPCTVTLASCDGGKEGDVVFGGASMAYTLHEAGVPLVIASQLPMTKTGSVLLTQELYGRLLWGEDPRRTLVHVRQTLHGVHSFANHDWAALIAYAAFPANFEDQLQELQYWQARRKIACGIRVFADGGLSAEVFRAAMAYTQDGARRLPAGGMFTVETLGLRAAERKRAAEWRYRALGDGESSAKDMITDLVEAHSLYHDATWAALRPHDTSRFEVLLHWVATQELCLQAVLGMPPKRDKWHLAVLSAKAQLSQSGVGVEESVLARAWAHGSLLELKLLTGAAGFDDEEVTRRADQARHHATEIVNLVDSDSYVIESTRRHLLRYVRWWSDVRFERALDYVLGERMLRARTAWWPQIRALAAELAGAFGEDEAP